MKIFAIALSIAALAGTAQADDFVARSLNGNFVAQSLIQDFNGDGQIEIAAFGDSITRGAGDFTSPDSDIASSSIPSGEAGYPLRVETLVGVPVLNLGLPGERLTEALPRFVREIPNGAADTVIISGGSNDAAANISGDTFFYALQTMINIARAAGKEVMLASTPPVCLDHQNLGATIGLYDSLFAEAATINDLTLARVKHAFSNSCEDANCALLNRPEGLHPNTDGYDVQAEAIIAGLLNIDLFTDEGQREYEDALGLPVGSVKTKTDANAIQ